ncbi:hypothetical protein Mal52_13620 [Symmachiella dynata]|uniref:Uncharacterized protein n=1 Tax=Symmachiella dynata TaxID=2527995 RepID=A0A517ZKF4_9PLAN|nr:hypothetical protein Mal52_13620 [Symmachiella dynata]
MIYDAHRVCDLEPSVCVISSDGGDFALTYVLAPQSAKMSDWCTQTAGHR